MELILACPDKLVIRNLQFFISKLRYEGEEFSLRDLEVLHLVYLRALEISEHNPDWKRKYLVQLLELQEFIKHIRIHCSFKKSKETWWRFPREIAENLILSPRRFFGLKGQKDFIVASLKRKQQKQVKVLPTRWMAVGYKDKGTRRNPAVDGSPTWKEVCISENVRQSWQLDQKIDYSLTNIPCLTRRKDLIVENREFYFGQLKYLFGNKVERRLNVLNNTKEKVELNEELLRRLLGKKSLLS